MTTTTTYANDLHNLSERVQACLARIEDLEQQLMEERGRNALHSDLIECLADSVTKIAESTLRQDATVRQQVDELTVRRQRRTPGR